MKALLALPGYLAALVGLHKPPGVRRPAALRIAAGLPLGLVMSVVGLFMLATLARLVYYPFWAFGAPRADLVNSWGGPSPFGATMVHWLIGVLVLVAGDLVLRAGGHLYRRLLFVRLPG
ncbi:MAG: hypothetical protein AUI14_18760 [Actinobacteria bacterium 13_2_20CM_2_71_6]|nr:MAG: hypothetical protein AUI14_18760 [Actinobacteria bacterium 13_2_20CM_2_71_6]